jgi:hypothetical protein
MSAEVPAVILSFINTDCRPNLEASLDLTVVDPKEILALFVVVRMQKSFASPASFPDPFTEMTRVEEAAAIVKSQPEPPTSLAVKGEVPGPIMAPCPPKRPVKVVVPTTGAVAACKNDGCKQVISMMTYVRRWDRFIRINKDFAIR